MNVNVVGRVLRNVDTLYAKRMTDPDVVNQLHASALHRPQNTAPRAALHTCLFWRDKLEAVFPGVKFLYGTSETKSFVVLAKSKNFHQNSSL